MNKWLRLLDTKPVPLSEHLAQEVARLFAADLKAWPPPLEELSLEGVEGRKLAKLLADWPTRPDERAYRVAFHLARLDLSAQLEAHDAYLKQQRWSDEGLTAKEVPMLLFLSRLISEQLLSLSEATQGRVNRARRLDILERTARLVVGA